MEQNNPTAKQVEESEDIVAKARANKKTIIYGLITAFVILIGVMIWLLVSQAGSRKADELVAKADAAMVDSVATDLYAKAAQAGYKSGNRAAAEAGIRLYRDGKYEEALKYAEKYSTRDEIIGAGALALKGDCLVNLDKLSDAVSAYKEAISISDHNPAYTPYFIMKLARVYREQGNFAEEAKVLEEIQNEYPLYGQQHNLDIEKLLDRARLQAAK